MGEVGYLSHTLASSLPSSPFSSLCLSNKKKLKRRILRSSIYHRCVHLPRAYAGTSTVAQQQVSLLPVTPASCARVLVLILVVPLPIQLPITTPEKTTNDGSSARTRATHMEDVHGALGAWLWPGLLLALAAMWGANQELKNLSPSF